MLIKYFDPETGNENIDYIDSVSYKFDKDKNIKNINQDKTIGIIVYKKENKFIIEYSSDSRIFETSYELC